jgi:glycine/D-amino acid oxidase-like deaminating enzyme
MSNYSPKLTFSVNISYWELKQYFSVFDLIVIGSGIVGLNAAIHFKKKRPKSRVLVIEKGVLPSGASSKNAGFACFGSPSELIADLSKTPEDTVWETVKMRWEGLKLLRKNLGDKGLDFHNWGGYELFNTKESYEACADNVKYLNKKASEYIGKKNTYAAANSSIKKFGFKGVKGMIMNRHEGQIDTSKMVDTLLHLALKSGVKILNSCSVQKLLNTSSGAELESSLGTFRAKKVIVAVNGFAKELLSIKDVEPARAQVLITKPVKGLKLKGTFHYNEGFYYFRNIDGRVLFGGGRNLDFKGETTSKIAITEQIQSQLEQLLKTVILPGQKFEIEHRWAGIMGVGSEKKPIITHYADNIICAVRMGGMGVAIGSLVGREAAVLAFK